MANALNKITTKSILDATVATADIAADAITGAKIADDAIDSEHYTDGSIDTAHLADDAITGAKISNNAIATAKIPDDAVTQAKLADDAVGTAQISGNAVTTAKIVDDNITQAKIAAGAVGGTELSDNSVTLAKMAGGTDGQIITYDASGDPVAVGPGTDGQVLTSTGSGSPPAFETPAAGVGGATGVDFNDDVKIRSGTGNDLEIYHSGSHSHIKDSGTGHLQIDGSRVQLRNVANDDPMVDCTGGGTVEIFHNGVKKLETMSTGIIVKGAEGASGELDIYADEGDDAADKWKLQATAAGAFNIYNNDGNWQERLTMSSTGGALKGTWNATGHVLQVVQTVKQDTWSADLSNATLSAVVTGLTVNITPSSSSNKVLIMASIAISQEHSDRCAICITRGGATIDGAKGTAVSNRLGVGFISGVSSSTQAGSTPCMYLDSPSATSQQTYGIKVIQGTGATSEVVVNYQATGDSDEANRFRYVSTITAMEIGG